MSETKPNDKVMRYYINIPKYDGLTKAECSKIWGTIIRLLNNVYLDNKYYEVVNTFDTVEVPSDIKNREAYILGKELELAAKADSYVTINFRGSNKFCIYESIDDMLEWTSDYMNTIHLDSALFKLVRTMVADENEMLSYKYSIKE